MRWTPEQYADYLHKASQRIWRKPVPGVAPMSKIGRPKKDRGTRICEHCSAVFQLTTVSPNKRFCTIKCAAQANKSMSENRRVMPVTKKSKKKCEYCGKWFASWDCNNQRFCSISCGTLSSAKVRTVAFNAPQNKGRIYSRCKRGWTEVGGKRFFARSKWESNYGRFLQFQKDNGLILDWSHETKTFWFEGIKRGVCSFLPDFQVETKNGTEFHEVKGWMDARSKTKIRRMKKYHPEVLLIVIDEARYKSISTSARNLIPGWEK